jgi:glycosyltransferase involved in cell wall biosynthesis
MTERTKVMQIIARMNVGGPAVIVTELMRGLDSTCFEQVLVTGYCDETESDYLEESATDIEVTRIAGLGRSVSPIADFKSLINLVTKVRTFKPDIIHTHTAKAGVLGRLASIIAGRRVTRIHTFHGHLLHGYFSGWKTMLIIAVEKILAKHTQVLIAIGNEVKRDLLKAGIGSENQYRISFPGLPSPHTAGKADIRKNLGLDDAKIYCTYVGRLSQIKRPDRLLDIAAAMVNRDMAVHFLVAGEGELFESSKARAAAENLPVTFLGWRKDIDELFAASDIAILTSDNEGIPLTLIQAAQAGLPIIATEVGSISDIVENGKNGILAAPEPGALAIALSELVNDSALRNRLGTEGKVRANKFFTIARMLSDHTELYSQPLKS